MDLTIFETELDINTESKYTQLVDYLRTKVSKSKDRDLLMEAYRRRMMFQDNKPLESAWVGLGTPGQYGKSVYFKAHRELFARESGWWLLTDLGIDFLQKLIETVPFPTNTGEISELNYKIFAR